MAWELPPTGPLRGAEPAALATLRAMSSAALAGFIRLAGHPFRTVPSESDFHLPGIGRLRANDIRLVGREDKPTTPEQVAAARQRLSRAYEDDFLPTLLDAAARLDLRPEDLQGLPAVLVVPTPEDPAPQPGPYMSDILSQSPLQLGSNGSGLLVVDKIS